MSRVRIFVSYDVDHDARLFELLLAESKAPGSAFEVAGASEHLSASESWSDGVRHRIQAADQMIVICGEHTEASIGMSTELRIAREVHTPYFLLWGEREVMCTKPVGAKPSEGIYSWTRPILANQIAMTLRNARWDREAGDSRDRRGEAPASGQIGRAHV